MQEFIQAALKEAESAVTGLLNGKETLQVIENAASALANAFDNSGRAFSCGNGGSMCDSIHFAEELTGRFRKNRRGLPAVAISDPGYITCAANDFGYEFIFSRFIESHGQKGDVLFALSTSGGSKNVLAAVKTAKELGMTVISLTGKRGSAIGSLADYDICTPAGQFCDRIQELNIKVIHILIELVERKLFPENY